MERLGENEAFSPSETNEPPLWLQTRKDIQHREQGHHRQAGSTLGLRLSFVHCLLIRLRKRDSEDARCYSHSVIEMQKPDP